MPVVTDLCAALGWLEGRFVTSPKAKPAALTGFHTVDYIDALRRAEETGTVDAETRARHQIGTLSNPVFPQIYSRPATGAGGVMLAAEMLANGAGRVYVPGGGTHHGMPDRANGFCYLNDPVLAIQALRRAGFGRVAYVDIDAHHCDGVEAAFAGEAGVRMISVHEEGRWPFTGGLGDDAGGAAFNLPVPRGFNDTEMRAVVARLIVPRVAAFAPDVIVLQAGADSLTEDPLSRLCLSNRAYVECLRALLPLADRFLLLGGGGYNPWSVGRCWAALWAAFAGFAVPERLPAAAEAVLRALDWGGGGRPLPEEAMMVTLLDASREGPVRAEVSERLAVLEARG